MSLIFTLGNLFLNSSLEINITRNTNSIELSRLFTFRLKLTNEQQKEVRTYLDSLSVDMILFGLRFAYKRERAISGGYLMPGRKSIVKKETLMLSHTQARWRLNNWKAMIRSYRDKRYSYPTISRIKKEMRVIADIDKAQKKL